MKKLVSLLLVFVLVALFAVSALAEAPVEPTAEPEEAAQSEEQAVEETTEEAAEEQTTDAEESKSWFDEKVKGFYLKDIFRMKPMTAAVLLALLVLGIALLMAGRQKWTARMLAYAALCLAISYVLSCIRLYRMPAGGSVVLCAILPITAFAYYAGVWQGLLVGVAYGLLQILQGAWIVNPIQGIMEYILAPVALPLFGGLARGFKMPEKYKLPAGLILGTLLRYCLHVAAGVLYFSQDAIDAGQAPLAYSLVYNLFLAPEAVLSVIVSLIPAFTRVFEPLRKAAKG